MTEQPDKHEQASTARQRLRSVDSGVLSTMSKELPGYPFGSVTPYVMTHEGRLAVYVSGIAQHTHNMDADPRVCLTAVAQGDGAENQQALWRVTLVGDATRVAKDAEDAVKERYFALFPEARAYAGTHDFHIYWIEAVRVRYIGGFGKIYWVEADDWKVATPEWSAGESGIIEHMNKDHGASVLHIARRQRADVQAAEMIAVDCEGFHIRADGTPVYIPFPTPCTTPEDLRTAMIQLAREAAPAE